MATQFIGLHMKVVLREPVGQVLTGTVRDVQAGSGLTLTNVFIPATKDWLPQIQIDATNIADLSEIPADGPLPSQSAPTFTATPVVEPPPVSTYSQTHTPSQSQSHIPPTQSTFVDPAILSLGRRPKSGASSHHGSPDKVNISKETKPSPVGILRGSHTSRQLSKANEDIADTLRNLNVNLTIGKDGHTSKTMPEPSKDASPATKKKARTRPHKSHKERRAAGSNGQSVDLSPSGHGRGWRQTPILQSTASFQPFSALKRKNGKSSQDNGWASEDVTEEMGEFDFENNLAKFDKRTIFDQMRKDDQVDDSSRLVSHNRRVKPGTAGGKNLHYTENVLDLPPTTNPPPADFWNSEADINVDGGERLSGRDQKNGQGMRRTESKQGSARRSQSRKASTSVGGQPLSRVNSSVRPYQTSRLSSPTVGHRSTDYEQQGARQAGLYLVPSNRRLETISSLQMLNVENIAANEIGFTESLMSENAGRGIAEVAVTALSDPSIKVRFEMAGSTSASSLGSSTVVILASNNKSSIRALAAGRHLRNKNIDVVVCLVGIERERDLLEDLRRQVQLYRNFGGKVLGKNDFFEYIRKGSESTPGLSISLIIDTLLGLTMSFEELRVGDQASVYELMEWANRNEAYVLAVDVPSGIDPTSGKVAIIDGSHLFVKPRYVVAIGAPKRGLLEAVTPPPEDDPIASNSAHDDDWRLFIVDLGLGSAVWKKAGTKMRRGVEFDGKWVLEMRYRDARIDSGSE